MASIEDYYHDFHHLQEDFEENLEKYPLFEEMVNSLFDHEIKEINELLDKNDEFYLKKAISKLEDVNKYIIETSEKIKSLHDEYDTLAKKWNKVSSLPVSDKVIDDINAKLKKANSLIYEHDIKSLEEACKLMRDLLKEVSKYSK